MSDFVIFKDTAFRKDLFKAFKIDYTEDGWVIKGLELDNIWRIVLKPILSEGFSEIREIFQEAFS